MLPFQDGDCTEVFKFLLRHTLKVLELEVLEFKIFLVITYL